ncbi:MAG: hypothetical protein ACFCVE_10110 [Phycisphaerae bacterium]
MGNTWVKIKFFTKIGVIVLLAVYGLFFLFNNFQRVDVWLFFGPNLQFEQTPMVFALLVAFLLGMLATLLVRTTLVTLKEFRGTRDRTRTERLEREMSEMKRKAGRLRTAPPPEQA